MKLKHIAFGFLALSAVLGWNIFLIQRDDKLFRSYYKQQAIENLKLPYNSEIK